MEEIGLEELTPEQQEQLCILAEKAARDYILSKIPPRKINTLNITIEIEGKRPITINAETEIQLASTKENIDINQLAEQATKKAIKATDEYLRQIVCKSKKP